ncbi:glycosyltransferase family 2 protein [Vibrio vulnificus]|nr:glycosyltransferase family 2 protein [Vibrio vulnificus]EJE8668281.1 glycosyltransferase family 2 protein [Vibrio vulnificus]
MLLSIGISTVLKNKDRAIELALSLEPFIDLGLIHEIVILCQLDEFERLEEIKNNIYFYSSLDSGLSKSRNFIKDKLTADFVWLLDDDVIVGEKELRTIHKCIEDNINSDIVIGQIYCSDKDQYYKNNMKRSGISGLLKTSSIEIISRRSFLVNNDIRYRESFGVGAIYPCGEENYFLIEAKNRGAREKFVDEVFVFHPCNNTESRLDYFGSKECLIPKVALCHELPMFYSMKYGLKVILKLVLLRRFSLMTFFVFSLLFSPLKDKTL